MTSDPLISIVIANYNYGRFLGEAIESLLSQSCQDYELIICDGGSIDNSVEVIKKYAAGLPPNTEKDDTCSARPCLAPSPISWWCSEKDGGQSAAFNKGFSHAKGKYITWLNADDVYLPGALNAVCKKLRRTDADWATANFVRFESNTRRILEAKWGPHFLPRWMQGNGWPIASYGPTTFWKRSIYVKLGIIREDFHYTMDTEYWVRMYVSGIKQVRINKSVWGFRMHDESKTAEYGSHVGRSETVARIEEERLLMNRENDYHESRFKKLIVWTWRLLDASFAISMIRKLLVIGKPVDLEYK